MDPCRAEFPSSSPRCRLRTAMNVHAYTTLFTLLNSQCQIILKSFLIIPKIATGPAQYFINFD